MRGMQNARQQQLASFEQSGAEGPSVSPEAVVHWVYRLPFRLSRVLMLLGFIAWRRLSLRVDKIEPSDYPQS